MMDRPVMKADDAEPATPQFDRKAYGKWVSDVLPDDVPACAWVAARCALLALPAGAGGTSGALVWAPDDARAVVAAILVAHLRTQSGAPDDIDEIGAEAYRGAYAAALSHPAQAPLSFAAAYAVFAAVTAGTDPVSSRNNAVDAVACAGEAWAGRFGAEQDFGPHFERAVSLALLGAAGEPGRRTLLPPGWSSAMDAFASIDPVLPRQLKALLYSNADLPTLRKWLEAWHRKMSPDAPAGEARTPEARTPEARTTTATLAGTRMEALAEADCLGREHITEALFRLLTERGDDQHFALGLFGFWGAGKSSLINLLRKRLDAAGDARLVVADFNAWRNEKASNLGAMLAQSVVDALVADLGAWGKLRLAVKLAARRRGSIRKDLAKDGDRVLARVGVWGWLALPPLLTLMVAGVLLWAVPLPAGSALGAFARWSGAIGLAVAAGYRSVGAFLENNLTQWFKRAGIDKPASLLSLPDYAEHRGLLADIHRTLSMLCELRLGEGADKAGRGLLLVVDDLDRCAVNTVKEVFDAVRLVADIPRVMTIVAIDERMAFAAVEKHYDQFGHAGRPPAQVAREYLAKVLQVSISLPDMGERGVGKYVSEVLFRGDRATAHASASAEAGNGMARQGEGPLTGDETIPLHAASSAAGDRPDQQFPEPSSATPAEPARGALPEEVALFEVLARAFDFANPRLLLRVYLGWRLLRSLAFAGGIYDLETMEKRLTLMFWREWRLQQPAAERAGLDAWLAGGSDASRVPEAVRERVAALRELATQDPAELSGWIRVTDSVLLPASQPPTSVTV